MQFVRQMGAGLLYGILSIILVVGVLSLALAESYTSSHPGQASVPSLPPSIISPTPASPTTIIGGTSVSTLTPFYSTSCPHPAGWSNVTLQPGDTLVRLAIQYRTSVALLIQANCLLSSSLAAGSGLYVPLFPTRTLIACHPFPGWIAGYTVQAGDTLFHIALAYGITVDNLKFANCKTSNDIFPGERLWVPNLPTRTAGVTIIPEFGTPTEIPTLPLTLTPLPFTETTQATLTSLPATDTIVPSDTPVPTTPTP